MTHDLESVALTLVADGKGILAADETVPTLTSLGATRARYWSRPWAMTLT
jgi:fructose-bisphosphate aldolase class 1